MQENSFLPKKLFLMKIHEKYYCEKGRQAKKALMA